MGIKSINLVLTRSGGGGGDGANCVFYNGDTVNGTCEVEIDSRNDSAGGVIKAIVVRCRGVAKAYWTEYRASKMNKRLLWNTANAESKSLFQAETIFTSNKGGTLAPGQHRFMFSFKLPDEVSTSMEDEYGYVRYWIEAENLNDGKWYYSPKTKLPLKVLQVIDPNHSFYKFAVAGKEMVSPMSAICSIIRRKKRPSGPGAIIEASTDRAAYCPRDPITIDVSFRNESNKPANLLMKPYVQLVENRFFYAEGRQQSRSRSYRLEPLSGGSETTINNNNSNNIVEPSPAPTPDPAPAPAPVAVAETVASTAAAAVADQAEATIENNIASPSIIATTVINNGDENKENNINNNKTAKIEQVNSKIITPITAGQESQRWTGMKFRIPECGPSIDCGVIKVAYHIEVGIDVAWADDLEVYLPVVIATLPTTTANNNNNNLSSSAAGDVTTMVVNMEDPASLQRLQDSIILSSDQQQQNNNNNNNKPAAAARWSGLGKSAYATLKTLPSAPPLFSPSNNNNNNNNTKPPEFFDKILRNQTPILDTLEKSSQNS